MADAVQQTIRFTGRVQGVGFRATTVQLSSGLGLEGTVRNLGDGSVELVVAGPPGKIAELVDRLRGRFGPGIEAADVESQLPLSEPTAPAGIRIVG
ncbi:MAG: acylphosphatase [Planctomycetota bacterium]